MTGEDMTLDPFAIYKNDGFVLSNLFFGSLRGVAGESAHSD